MADIARARVPVVFDPKQIQADAKTAIAEGTKGTELTVPMKIGGQDVDAQTAQLLASKNPQLASALSETASAAPALNATGNAVAKVGEEAEQSGTRIAGLTRSASFLGRQLGDAIDIGGRTTGTLAALTAMEANTTLATGSLSAAMGSGGLVVAGVAALAVLTPLIAGLFQTHQALLDDSKAAQELQHALADLGKDPGALDKTIIGQLLGDQATDGTRKLAGEIDKLGIPMRTFLDEVEKGTSSLGDLAKNSNLRDFAGDAQQQALNAQNLHNGLEQAAAGGDKLAGSLLNVDLSTREGYQSVVDFIRGLNEFSGNTDSARQGQAALNEAMRAVPPANALYDWAAASKQLASDEADLLTTQQSLASTQLAAAEAPLKVADAQAQLRDAQRALTEGAVDEERQLDEAVDSATVRLQKAKEAADEMTFAQARAHLANAEAEAEITLQQANREALRARTPDEQLSAQKQLLQAQDALQKSKEDIAGEAQKEADARQVVADAENNLYDAQRKRAEFADTVADKERAVKEAELGVESALIAQATADANERIERDKLNGVNDSATRKAQIFGEELEKQAASQTSGTIHDGLQALITDYTTLQTILDQISGKQQTIAGNNVAGDFSSLNPQNYHIETAPDGTQTIVPNVQAPSHAIGGETPGGPSLLAEQGFEIGLFPKPGIYSTPPGQILDHSQSVDFVKGMTGGQLAQPISQPIDFTKAAGLAQPARAQLTDTRVDTPPTSPNPEPASVSIDVTQHTTGETSGRGHRSVYFAEGAIQVITPNTRAAAQAVLDDIAYRIS